MLPDTRAATPALRVFLAAVLGLLLLPGSARAADVELWRDRLPRFTVHPPDQDPAAAALLQGTLCRLLGDLFGVQAPDAGVPTDGGLRIIAGHPGNNSQLRRLVEAGLSTTGEDLGDEGFQLLSHDGGEGRALVLYANTPRALKHACQELLFFQARATGAHGVLAWPVNMVRRPQVAYRGSYILPCWAQHDSVESWERVLRFHSELTLNRNWFWLDGFPVAGHPAVSHVPGKTQDFDKSPLADDDAIRRLIDLSNQEGMKFLIGGGWMSWHHEQVAGKDPIRARQFYLDYLREFPGIGGFYFEPTGEGSEVANWRPEAESLHATITEVLSRRPDLEVALAIGRFNHRDYQSLLSRLDSKRAFWWWCWGDPHTDGALERYPSVLGWHTTVRMSDIHGTTSPPAPRDLALAGMVTSYDPGMGFGNPWNGGATLGGAPGPRNFDPYTMPYFSHEYRYREHCWNVRITDDEFAARLGNRLFDADMPPEAVRLYLQLADLCFQPALADRATLEPIEKFVRQFSEHGTPRNRDTLRRMAEAVRGLTMAAQAQSPSTTR